MSGKEPSQTSRRLRCPCGHGSLIESTSPPRELEGYADWPNPRVVKLAFECPDCSLAFEIATWDASGSGPCLQSRAALAAFTASGSAVNELTRKLMRIGKQRHLTAWLSLFESKTLAQTRALLPEPWSARALSRAMKTALGGREGFLTALLTPDTLPRILSTLGRVDEEVERLSAALGEARAELARTGEELRRTTIRPSDLQPR